MYCKLEDVPKEKNSLRELVELKKVQLDDFIFFSFFLFFPRNSFHLISESYIITSTHISEHDFLNSKHRSNIRELDLIQKKEYYHKEIIEYHIYDIYGSTE